MTALLENAIDRLAKLPEQDQEFYARQLLKELDANGRWDELFSHTTDEQWIGMVAEAKRDAKENGTLSLDDLLGSL